MLVLSVQVHNIYYVFSAMTEDPKLFEGKQNKLLRWFNCRDLSNYVASLKSWMLSCSVCTCSQEG